jgi:hypothetical protein
VTIRYIHIPSQLHSALAATKMPSLKQVALTNWIEVAISLIETHTNETKHAFPKIRSGRGAETGLAKLDNSLTLGLYEPFRPSRTDLSFPLPSSASLAPV